MKSGYLALVFALTVSTSFCEMAYADRSSDNVTIHHAPTTCRFLKSMEFELPFNSTALSNENRRAIEKAVKDAKKWPSPAVGIQAIVTAGAYIGERDLDVLQDRRGEAVRALLRKLGIPSKNIYVEPVTMTDNFIVKRPDGELAVRQIEIELSPICNGSCEWMCGDPRPQ